MSYFSVFSSLPQAIVFLVLAKLTSILLCVWGIHWLLKGRNPRWRILTWRIAAIALVGTILLSLREPLVNLPLLPALSKTIESMPQQSESIARDTSSSMQADDVQPDLPFQTKPTYEAKTKLPANPMQRPLSSVESSIPTDTPTNLRAPINFEPSPSMNTSWPISYWIWLVWAIGVVLGITRLSVGVFYLKKLRQSSAIVPEAIEAELAQLMANNPRVRAVSVRQSKSISAPCSIGIYTRTIMLPSSTCSPGNTDEVRSMLAHEIAHFAGNDLCWNYVLNLLSIVLWFHPLLWRARLAHADACDQRCDADATSYLKNTESYTRLLAKIALQLANRTPSSALPMARSSNVVQRINVLTSGIGQPHLNRWKAVLTLLIASTAIFMIAVAGVTRSIAQPTANRAAATDAQTQPDNAEHPEGNSKPVFSGTIIDKSGNPVTDATIELTGQKRSGTRHYEAKVDEDGHYIFSEVLQEDTYRVRITSTGWVGITNWRQLPKVQLGPASSIVRDFQLQKACTIRIRTIDEKGEPVPNVRIYSASLSDERWGNSNGVSTDKSGWATIGGLSPSQTDYIFGTSSREYACASLVKTLDDPDTAYEETVTLAVGVEVSGKAVCSDNKPAAGWSIRAMPTWWHFGVSPGGVEIGEDGSFTLSHIAPDKYDVTVGVPTGEGMFRQERALSDVSLPTANGSLDVRLRVPSPKSMVAISGTVTTSGRPLKETITIFARSENGEHNGSGSVVPGKDAFRISPLPPGRYTVTFSSTEVEQKRISGVNAPTDDLQVELTVTGKPKLAGRVIDASTKKPLSNFKIRVLKVGYLRGPNYVQDSQWQLIENPEGEFAIDVVGPGIYQVVATAEGLAPAKTDPINTDEYKGDQLTLELSSGVSIRGMIVDEQGNAISGAIVTPLSDSLIVPRGGQRNALKQDRSAKTVQGQFTLNHLAPGPEKFKVTHPDYTSATSDEVSIDAEDIELPPITLSRGAIVRGFVYDSTGKPEPNVTLYFQDRSAYGGRGAQEIGRIATVVTDQSGRYQAQHLPEQLCYVQRAEEWNGVGVVRMAILPTNGAEQRLDLGGEEAITGRLLENGKPLSNVRVQLGGTNPNFGLFKAFAQTNTNGEFTFWGPSHGSRVLYYQAPEGRNTWIRGTEVSVGPKTQSFGEVDIRSVSLKVSVHGMPNSLANRARVSLIEYNPIWAHGNDVGIMEPRQSAQEPFLFRRVPHGTYELICRRDDGLTLRKVVQVDSANARQQATLDWPTETGTLLVSLDKSLCGPGGCNPPNLWSDDQQIKGTLYSQDGKELRLVNVPAGKYYLADKDTRDADREFEFSVKPGETETLDLTPDTYVPKPVDVGVHVVRCFTTAGVPLLGCQVEFESSDNDIRRSSAQYGRQTFTGTPGEYTMSVSFPGYKKARRKVTLIKVAPDGRAVGDFETSVRLAEE